MRYAHYEFVSELNCCVVAWGICRPQCFNSARSAWERRPRQRNPHKFAAIDSWCACASWVRAAALRSKEERACARRRVFLMDEDSADKSRQTAEAKSGTVTHLFTLYCITSHWRLIYSANSLVLVWLYTLSVHAMSTVHTVLPLLLKSMVFMSEVSLYK